jgi:hypothetical protein
MISLNNNNGGGGKERDHREIVFLVLRLMNERFTWTHGPLTLTPSTATIRDPRTGFVVAARGELIVAEDRWSAMLVVCFLRWVSERLPQSFVELDDESGLCHLGLIILKTGRFGVPIPGDARQRRLAADRVGGVGMMLRALAMAASGEFLLRVPASEYADRPEMQRLGLREAKLRRMSLEQLADRMPLPWKTERLEAN